MPNTPVIHDPDSNVYFRENEGRFLAGGFEPEAKVGEHVCKCMIFEGIKDTLSLINNILTPVFFILACIFRWITTTVSFKK